MSEMRFHHTIWKYCMCEVRKFTQSGLTHCSSRNRIHMLNIPAAFWNNHRNLSSHKTQQGRPQAWNNNDSSGNHSGNCLLYVVFIHDIRQFNEILQLLLLKVILWQDFVTNADISLLMKTGNSVTDAELR